MPSNAPISLHDQTDTTATAATAATAAAAAVIPIAASAATTSASAPSAGLTSASGGGGGGGGGGDINFTELGRRFPDLAPGNIQAAIARACAEAAMRGVEGATCTPLILSHTLSYTL